MWEPPQPCEFLGLGTIKLGGSYTILAVIRPLCRKAQNAAAHWPRPGHARNSSSDSDSEWPGVRIKFSGKLEAQLGLILRRVILIFTRVKGSSLGRQEIGPGVIGNLLLSRGLFFTKSLNDHWRLSPKPPELVGFYVESVWGSKSRFPPRFPPPMNRRRAVSPSRGAAH